MMDLKRKLTRTHTYEIPLLLPPPPRQPRQRRQEQGQPEDLTITLRGGRQQPPECLPSASCPAVREILGHGRLLPEWTCPRQWNPVWTRLPKLLSLSQKQAITVTN